MNERTTIQEVFAEVEPDPDAILEGAGVDSPAELVERGGRHDPIADDLTAEEASVDELFETLREDGAFESIESADHDRGQDRDGERAVGEREDVGEAQDDGGERDDSEERTGEQSIANAADDSARESAETTDRTPARPTERNDAIGGPSVTVLPGDGAVIDELLDDDSAPDDSDSGLELVGGPTVDRVANDGFSGS